MTHDNNTYVALRSKMIMPIYGHSLLPGAVLYLIITMSRQKFFRIIQQRNTSFCDSARSSQNCAHSISTTQSLLVMCDSLVTTSSQEPKNLMIFCLHIVIFSNLHLIQVEVLTIYPRHGSMSNPEAGGAMPAATNS